MSNNRISRVNYVSKARASNIGTDIVLRNIKFRSGLILLLLLPTHQTSIQNHSQICECKRMGKVGAIGGVDFDLLYFELFFNISKHFFHIRLILIKNAYSLNKCTLVMKELL